MTTELKGKEYVKAKVLGGGVSETKAGKPQAFITVEDEHARTWVWTGSFNEGKAREITMKTLETCGFKGGMNDLVKGVGFETGKEVSLTIDDKWNEDNTKSFRTVAWINGLSKGATLMEETDALLKMQGMGLGADFAAMFGGQPAHVKEATSAENVPF